MYMTTWKRFWVYPEFTSLNIQHCLIGRKNTKQKLQRNMKYMVHESLQFPELASLTIRDQQIKTLSATYEGGSKNNRNLNVARELEVVARCAAGCRESTQYSSRLPRGVNLG